MCDDISVCPNCGGVFHLDDDYCESCNYWEGR